MEDFWARFIEPSGQPGLNYWEYFAKCLVNLANIPNNAWILDIGTYDGNVLTKAMKKMENVGYGIGADIYSGGFKDGIEDVTKQALQSCIAFVQMDANALGFLTESFHTVLANFVGWDDCFDFEQMNFIRTDSMMSEIRRVLKPGGQVGIGGWVEQRDIDWIIDMFKKSLPEYDNDFLCYAKENSEGQRIILENSGFEDIQVDLEIADFLLPDVEIWWRQMRQAAGDYFKQISDPETIAGFKDLVFAELLKIQDPKGIRFSKTVSFAFGTKPI